MAASRNREALVHLTTSNDTKSYFRNCDDDLIKAVSEVSYNILYNKEISLTEGEKVSIRPHESTLLLLASKSTSIYRKRQILIQIGDKFVQTLLKIALTWLSA